MKNGNKKILQNKKFIFASAAMIAGVVVIVILLIVGMRNAVNDSIYAERKDLLGRLTESSAGVVNENLAYGQKTADIISDNAVLNMRHYSELSEYMDAVSKLPGYEDILFYFVDSNGKYYSSDGVYGKIVDSTYYTASSEDKVSYISTLPHLGNEKVYMIFRNRLPAGITVKTGHGDAEMVYCGMLYDIDELNEIISQEFAGENNTFIYDDTNGVMMYKCFGIRLLIDGFNIYPKFFESRVIYGEDPAQLEQACRDLQTLVVALNIDGTEYYFCSAPIEHQNWSVAFIVQSKYLDDLSGNSFRNIILYMAVIAVILGAAVVVLMVSVYANAASRKSITEITKLNVELEEATKAKSEFLSNMSHDIRTPINGIMGMTVIARNVEGNPPKTNDCLDKIDGASRHLLSLINDVLDMSRIERGKTVIAQEIIDILNVCDNCCNIIHGQMLDRKLEFITEMN